MSAPSHTSARILAHVPPAHIHLPTGSSFTEISPLSYSSPPILINHKVPHHPMDFFFCSSLYLATLNELRVHSEIQTLFWGNVRDSASQPPHFLREQVERWTDAEPLLYAAHNVKASLEIFDVITEPPLCGLSNMICEQWDRKLCYQSWRGASRGVWHFIFSLPSQWQSSRSSLSV